jgi:hypothetical protein
MAESVEFSVKNALKLTYIIGPSVISKSFPGFIPRTSFNGEDGKGMNMREGKGARDKEEDREGDRNDEWEGKGGGEGSERRKG